MQEQILLQKIMRYGQTVQFIFSVSDGLKKYFSGKVFQITYPDDISNIPDAILSIPFVTNVLPLTWIKNIKLLVGNLDQTFYQAIPTIRKSYQEMYPKVRLGGVVLPSAVVDCNYPAQGKSSMFFSGGLDATSTLVSRFKEKPVLLFIWGSDIGYDNVGGMQVMNKLLTETAEKYCLEKAVIRSSFREFDQETVAEHEFSSLLNDSWWHGMKHAIALLGHVAPYAWIHQITTHYIASSYCMSDGLICCASNPVSDNAMQFAGCSIHHDGFDNSRQEKIRNVILFYRETGIRMQLHVCAVTQDGKNCNGCEKCYRTMMGFWAEGEDPKDYGFDYEDNIFMRIKRDITLIFPFTIGSQVFWKQIQSAVKENINILMNKPFYSEIRWIINFDFSHPNRYFPRKQYQICMWIRNKLRLLKRIIIKMTMSLTQ